MSMAKHRRRRNQVHQPGLTFVKAPKPPSTHMGIQRKPDRAKPEPRPLTGIHLAVRDQLSGEPAQVAAIARELGLPATSVRSAVYVLQARGLAHRIPDVGWVKSP